MRSHTPPEEIKYCLKYFLTKYGHDLDDPGNRAMLCLLRGMAGDTGIPAASDLMDVVRERALPR